MSFRSSLLAFAILHSAFVSQAAPPPELTVLRQQYDKVVTERVTAVFDASKAALDAKFTVALDNAIATAKGAGELKTVLALEAEKKRLADKLPIPAEDNAGPEALQKLRSIYQEQLTKLEEARTANHATLLPAYTAKLEALEVTLTKADRVAEAAEVLTYREGLKVGSVSTAATAPAAIPSTTPSTSASPSSPAPRLAKAQKAENTKRLMQWALANGHAITIKLGGKEQRIEPGAGLPDGEAILVSITRAASVPGVNEPPPWDALAGQEELREVYLADWKQSIASQDLASLAWLPALKSLELNSAMEGSMAAALPELPELVELRLKRSGSIPGADLAALVSKTPRLKEVLFDNGILTEEEFASVAGWKNLELLILGTEATRLSPAKIATLAMMPKLEKIMFYGCRSDALDSASMPKLKSVTKLQFNYNVSAANLQAALAMPKLSSLGFSDIKTLGEAELEIVSKVSGITKLELRNCHSVTDAGLAHILKIPGLSELEIQRCPGISAAAFESLSVLKTLRKLIVHQTTFDDAALMSLTRSRTLKDLGLYKTAVTDDAVKAFQKTRPDVKIDR